MIGRIALSLALVATAAGACLAGVLWLLGAMGGRA